jgi:hypothetical protein
MFICYFCSLLFRICDSYGGLTDVSDHLQTKIHEGALHAASSGMKLASFLSVL